MNYSYTTTGTEREVTVTDPLSRVSTSIYDENDRIRMSAFAGLSTTYSYGVLGNLSSVTDSSNRTTLYKYDSLGQMIQMIATGDVRTTYVYNPDGSMKPGRLG